MLWPARPLTLACFALLLAAFAYGGSLARYVADDFCTANIVVRDGLIGAQQFWYLHWSGRYSFIFLIDILNLLGGWTVPLTPLVLLTSWVLLTSFLTYRLLRPVCGPEVRYLAALLGLALPAITLATIPAQFESLYWQTGSVTYLLPIVLATGYAVLVWRAFDAMQNTQRAVPWTSASVSVIVLIAGCSETALGFICSGLGVAMLSCIVFSRGATRVHWTKILAPGLGAALVAALVVALAPGNGLRAAFSQRPSLAMAAIACAWYPFLAIASLVVRAPVYVVLTYLLPFIATRQAVADTSSVAPATLITVRRVVLSASFVVVAACGAPAFYIGGDVPPPRAQVIPQFVLLAAILCCGTCDGLRGSRRMTIDHVSRPHPALLAAMVGLLVAGPLFSTFGVLRDSVEMRAYAADLDALSASARDAARSGSSTLAVNAPRQPAFVTTAEIGTDPTAFPNSCVADYYGLQSIVVHRASHASASRSNIAAGEHRPSEPAL